MQRWPAVPIAEKATARRVRSRVGGRSDNRGVVAAELEDGAGKAGGELRTDSAAHRGRAGGGDQGNKGRGDEDLSNCSAADQEGREALWKRVAGFYNELCGCAFEDCLGGEGSQGRLLRGLPDDGVAADQRERGVPTPHGDREVERGDDADHTERMPGLHHAVVRALRGQGEAGDLARETGREGADVDHLLDFAITFGEELAGFNRYEASRARAGRF